MLIRRFTQHVRKQDWVAVVIDFVVVVVGIFLAFQLERWYSDQRSREESFERVQSLLNDVSFNKEVLEQSIGIRRSVIAASERLLTLDEDSPTSADRLEFYQRLSAASPTSTPRFRRGAYDVLISTGDIDLIADSSLTVELADFFARLDEFIIYNQGSWLVDRNTFEPYVIRELDYIEMLQYLHPIEGNYGIEQTRPTQDPGEFLNILGTAEFEGIIGAKWHVARDELIRLEALRDRLIEIENQLEIETSTYN